MLLANLAKSPSLERLITLKRAPVPELSPSPLAVTQLIELFNAGTTGKFNKDATYDYLAYLFGDLAKVYYPPLGPTPRPHHPNIHSSPLVPRVHDAPHDPHPQSILLSARPPPPHPPAHHLRLPAPPPRNRLPPQKPRPPPPRPPLPPPTRRLHPPLPPPPPLLPHPRRHLRRRNGEIARRVSLSRCFAPAGKGCADFEIAPRDYVLVGYEGREGREEGDGSEWVLSCYSGVAFAD